MTSGSIDIEGDLLARATAEIARAKTVAHSTRVCLIEPLGRGNSEAIASRSLFAVDLELGAFQY
jgi:hypothetical protein